MGQGRDSGLPARDAGAMLADMYRGRPTERLACAVDAASAGVSVEEAREAEVAAEEALAVARDRMAGAAVAAVCAPGGTMADVARRMGVQRATLYRRLRMVGR